ncbi:MAG TPA: SDR family NAD(P)-dependent oxidoreductase [Anaerolineales bacterium]|nr:SDR family NAD(P)-dependent oxidoreductase [Anaerolineales bacterium]
MTDIENKIVVITGASKGLGRETAIHLSRKKARVVLISRTETLLHQVRDEVRKLTGNVPLTIRCDISSETDVSCMAAAIQERFQRIDVLINNAGFGTYRVSENISNQEMRRHFEVNFFGAYYCIKALLPLLKQSEAGYVLNVGSLFSRVALAENSVYAATKFALAGFSEGLRREMKPFGIGVGLFLPGPMTTSFQETRDEGTLKSPKFMMLNPKKAASGLEKMIRQRKKQTISPWWMLSALKVRYSY